MRIRLIHILILTGLAVSFAGAASASVMPLRYVDETAIKRGGAVILDSRPSSLCEKSSLAGAHCLAVEDFLGLEQRLAGFANIAWVLGSAGLSGDEKVLVVGGNPVRRDFVAGLLYIMGQKDISILTTGLNKLKSELAPGTSRDMLRTKIWQADTRDEALVFVNELSDLLTGGGAYKLLDGRAEKAYWGREIRAARGGHLPGAEHVPAGSLRADVARGTGRLAVPEGGNIIVYGRNAVDGIAYMTLVMAGAGKAVRVFPGGWAKWAANGALPADAESHPDRIRKVKAGGAAVLFSGEVLSGVAAGLLLGAGLVLMGVWAHSRRKAV